MFFSQQSIGIAVALDSIQNENIPDPIDSQIFIRAFMVYQGVY